MNENLNDIIDDAITSGINDIKSEKTKKRSKSKEIISQTEIENIDNIINEINVDDIVLETTNIIEPIASKPENIFDNYLNSNYEIYHKGVKIYDTDINTNISIYSDYLIVNSKQYDFIGLRIKIKK